MILRQQTFEIARRALDSADVHVADLQLHQPSLDDVFLAKTGRKLDIDETPEEVAA